MATTTNVHLQPNNYQEELMNYKSAFRFVSLIILISLISSVLFG